MSDKYCFDEKCLDLASYFYPDAPTEKLRDLAQLLQQTVEEADMEPATTCRACNGAGNFSTETEESGDCQICDGTGHV